MQLQSNFTDTQRATIEALRVELSHHHGRAVLTDYGTTDDGAEHDVLLCVESATNAQGYPRPLVTIIAGHLADAFGVMAPNGSSLADGVGFEKAIQIAHKKAMGKRRL